MGCATPEPPLSTPATTHVPLRYIYSLKPNYPGLLPAILAIAPGSTDAAARLSNGFTTIIQDELKGYLRTRAAIIGMMLWVLLTGIIYAAAGSPGTLIWLGIMFVIWAALCRAVMNAAVYYLMEYEPQLRNKLATLCQHTVGPGVKVECGRAAHWLSVSRPVEVQAPVRKIAFA